VIVVPENVITAELSRKSTTSGQSFLGADGRETGPVTLSHQRELSPLP